VARAAERRVGVLALTDHDTLDGLPDALAAAAEHGVRLVCGIELSVRSPSGSMHLLGYLPGPAPEPLAGRIGEIAAFRDRRNRLMVERLAELGAPVAWEDVARRGWGRIGRPHIADALVAAGHALDRGDAFEQWIGSGCPAYVSAGSVAPADAVALVQASGGAAVIAHPGSLRLEPSELATFAAGLVPAGLRGLEVYRADQDPIEQNHLLGLCRRYGLVPTGGSDFHRVDPLAPDLGGGPPLPPDTVDRLFGPSSA
jgi:predicted metal-dependent phosphoesterase TrpH